MWFLQSFSQRFTDIVRIRNHFGEDIIADNQVLVFFSQINLICQLFRNRYHFKIQRRIAVHQGLNKGFMRFHRNLFDINPESCFINTQCNKRLGLFKTDLINAGSKDQIKELLVQINILGANNGPGLFMPWFEITIDQNNGRLRKSFDEFSALAVPHALTAAPSVINNLALLV